MRALQAQPRRKFAQIASATLPGIAHWAINETGSTTTVADFYGSSNLAWSTTTTTTATIYKHDASAFGGARSGNSATEFATGASTAGQRTALLGDWTFEWTGVVNSLAAAMTLASHGTTSGGTSATNQIFRVQVLTTGALQTFWQSGANVGHTLTSRAGVVTTGLHHIAVRKQIIGTTVYASFFVDGLFVGTLFDVTNATDGSSGAWALGKSTTGSAQIADVTHYECRLLAIAASASLIRENAARALRVWDLNTVIKDQNYSTFARVLVEDSNAVTAAAGYDTAMADIDTLADSASWEGHGYEFLESVDIEDDIDRPGASASVEVLREVFDWSLAPGMATTSPVSSAASVKKVLAVARRIQIETAVVPFGTERAEIQPWEWVNSFDGFISSVDWGDETIKINARDMIAPVSWTFCRPLAANNYQEKIYGDDVSGVAMETVIQSIIDDHVPATGMFGGTPTLFTPTSPSWNLRKRSIGFEPLLDVITHKAEQIGFVVRYKWDDNYHRTRLTLYAPARTSPSVVRTFQTNEYIDLSACSVNEENIRNVCEVVYTDRTAGNDTIDIKPRARYVSTDSTSISNYGERYCQITEDAASQIDTSTEAQKLADSVVSDLAEPKAIVTMEAGFLPFVEIDDYYSIVSNGLHFDATQSLGVTSIKHHIDGKGSGRTTLGLRGVPCGGVDKWIVSIAFPGIAPFAPFLPPEVPSAVTVTIGERRSTLEWPWPKNFLSKGFDSAEVHMTTASGAWTPDASTLKHVTRTNKATVPDLDPNRTYQCKVIFRDKKNNVTAAYDAGSFDPKPEQREVGTWLTSKQYVIQQDDNSTTMETFGYSAAPTEVTGGAAKAVSTDSSATGGRFIRYTASASAGTIDGGITAIGIGPTVKRNWLPMFSARIKLGSNVGNYYMWCGLWASSPATTSGDPSGPGANDQGFGFGYSSLDSSNLQVLRNDGSTWAGGALPVSGIGANFVLHLVAGFTDVNTLFYQVNGVRYFTNVTSFLPGTTTDLDFYCACRDTSNAATKNLCIGRLAVATTQ